MLVEFQPTNVWCRCTYISKTFLGFLKAFSEDPISGRSNHFYNYNLSKNQNALLFQQEIMQHNKSSVKSQKHTNSLTSRNFELILVFFTPLYYFFYFSCNISSTQFSFCCSLLWKLQFPAGNRPIKGAYSKIPTWAQRCDWQVNSSVLDSLRNFCFVA